MKNYSVSVIAFATVVVVNAKDEEEAMNLAVEEIDFGDLQMDEASVKEEIPQNDLKDHTRHADKVIRN